MSASSKLLFLALIITGLNTSAQVRNELANYLNQYGLDDGRTKINFSGKSEIHLLPGHRFYLAKKLVGNTSSAGNGWQVVRELTHDFCIVAISSPVSVSQILPNLFEFLSPANDRWKMAPGVEKMTYQSDTSEKQYLVQVQEFGGFRDFLYTSGYRNKILAEYPSYSSFLLKISSADFRKFLLPSPFVLFADVRPDGTPKEESPIPDYDLGLNRFNFLHARLPALNGRNMAVSLKEYRPDTTDIDFRDRIIPSSISTKVVSSHATTMATILAGGGNSFYSGKGVAWGARISSSSFLNLFPDQDTYYSSASISVQNHSYGLGIENYYGAEAQAYDQFVYQNPTFVHVFSAGNIGNTTSTEGPYVGVANFANLSGNFKMAKNLLTVGAIDSFYKVESRSSRGPAFDGRIKPELVAYGQDGSSGAAALTSGLVVLMQQAYRSLHSDSLPSAALIRAVLLNTAKDLGPEGPDYATGFGNIEANWAIQSITDQRFIQAKLDSGKLAEFRINVPTGAVNLKITLAWTDPPATTNAGRALVHDLDLRLVKADSSWLPWILNSYPHADSLTLAAIRGQDHLNNQEQISLQNPLPGYYTIQVRASTLTKEKQEFSIAYSWETAGEFQWTFPTVLDNAPPAKEVTIRWDAPKNSESGNLAYSFIGSPNWIPIKDSVALSTNYFQWNVPDTLALARLRMVTRKGVFISDTFTISSYIKPVLGFDCADSLLWYWPKMKGVTKYQIYTFDSNYLTPIALTTDTAIVLQKAAYPSSYFALAPSIEPGFLGLRSPTFRTSFQNAGCYFRSFFTDLLADQVRLRVVLGSLYLVESVFFEKLLDGKFLPLASFPASGTSFITEDLNLTDGLNVYRAGLRLKNEKILYSQENEILYANKNSYLVFPNPVVQNEEIVVVRNGASGESFRLFDSLGRIVMEEGLESEIQEISTEKLSVGIYFYSILKDGQRQKSGKIVVGGK